MKKHPIFAVIAILLIIAGFGMIHSTKGIMEIISILFIGMGTFYLLYLLFTSSKNRNES
ncbi:hypothetical protein [Breznakibacter xylanolyticus]|uniref:hypothetical protein n=1 Tax=Breznakibacter xylanolyticus TaxID=990 RepID=UPI0014726E5E|nr:hypothetical protein [Breznakibacter xylanolyticus]MBN2743147.1 hypothetical protein [Marinilabiliaceae bacterium]